MQFKSVFSTAILVTLAAAQGTLAQGPAAPPVRWEDYVFTSPLASVAEADRLAEYQGDRKAFMARYLPKLGLPVRREQFFGIWNYFNHGRRVNGNGFRKVYDGDPNKRTYFFSNGSGHNAVDWMTSFQEFGENVVVSPFPRGAVVVVTGASDHGPDVPDDWSLGNTLTLTCYLDGDPTNTATYNRFRVRFAHLEQHSIVVRRGDLVSSGQVVARIGYSGATSLSVTHIHAQYFYPIALDPFRGRHNPRLSESLFFDQGEIERITNAHYRTFHGHLRLNEEFFHRMHNHQRNTYRFTSLRPIERVLVVATPDGELPPVDILPLVGNVRRSQFTFVDDEGRRWTFHEARFSFRNQASRPGEWAFVSEDDRGRLSNRVWIDLR